MFGFLRRRNRPIALDLGSDSIKMLQMKRAGSIMRVTACGRLHYPRQVRDNPKRRRETAVSAVRQMLRSGGFVGRGVVTALSCKDMVIKNVRLPSMPPDQMDNAILWEAKERFGFDVAPDQLKCLHAGQVRQGSESREEVIMMAVSPQVIDEHLSLLSDMGLTPDRIEAEPVALFRSFERYLRRRSDEESVSVIVDIGYSATRVIVARGRQIVFVKSIDIGGAKLTEAVSKQLSIPLQEAEELRMRAVGQPAEESDTQEPSQDTQARSPRDTVDWTLHDAMRTEIEMLGKEIALCLRYCSVTFRGLRPKRITLTGGQAYDPAVVGLLSEHLNLPCSVGLLLKGFDLSSVDLGSDRRDTLSEWALCAGMAAHNANIPEVVYEDTDGHQDRLSA